MLYSLYTNTIFVTIEPSHWRTISFVLFMLKFFKFWVSYSMSWWQYWLWQRSRKIIINSLQTNQQTVQTITAFIDQPLHGKHLCRTRHTYRWTRISAAGACFENKLTRPRTRRH